MSARAALPDRVDLLVAGAGTAGAALAQLAAERGLSVLCLDRRPLDEAGARWINGVPRWAFDTAGVGQPRAPELRVDDTAAFHLVAGRGPARLVMRDHGVLDVDMRRLVARLQRQARGAGAVLIGGVRVAEIAGRRVSTSGGTLHAEVVVDATGEAGARLLGQEKTPPRDLCSAAQYSHRITDRSAASDFFREHGAEPGETLCFTSIAGGYSILNVKIHGQEVDLLTGSIPARGHPSGRRLIDDFVGEQPWIGARLFGGQRVIPLGRPRDELARGQVALIGDAARQVFSAHGSGIGAGMIAARLLADALAEGGGPEAYAFRWQRRFGGLFALFDLFRRFSETLDAATLERMIEAGILDETLARAGLAQRLPALSFGTVAAKIGPLAGAPRLALRMACLGARMAAVKSLYAAYPPDAAGRARWSRLAARMAARPKSPRR